MAYNAIHKFAKISPRKVKPLATMIRGQRADRALEILRYQPQRGARMLEKVLRSAIANAEDLRATNVGSLVVTEARVDAGPMFKRMRPRARGMSYMIKKRMSHIHVSVGNP